MRIFLVIFGLLTLSITKTAAQSQDGPETLQWVERQAARLDTILNSAVVSQNQTNILFSLLEAYVIFDAVSIAGVYCAPVREAAQAGRNQCDVVNYYMEKDLNTSLTRASKARIQAENMRRAALQCNSAVQSDAPAVFLPKNVMLEDVEIIRLDLEDGLASGSIHILSQKLEHSIQLLHDIQHLSTTLNDCQEVYLTSQEVVRDCEQVLVARNWVEVKKAVNTALDRVSKIPALICR